MWDEKERLVVRRWYKRRGDVAEVAALMGLSYKTVYWYIEDLVPRYCARRRNRQKRVARMVVVLYRQHRNITRIREITKLPRHAIRDALSQHADKAGYDRLRNTRNPGPKVSCKHADKTSRQQTGERE